ncbi:hypothetical protein CAPTEDRAFT_94809, partial [Capitella teleta]
CLNVCLCKHNYCFQELLLHTINRLFIVLCDILHRLRFCNQYIKMVSDSCINE